MEKLRFQTTIDAPPAKVWEVLCGEHTYPQWTAPFSPGSKVDTDWQKGSDILFQDANNDGMYGVIEETIAPKFMSFLMIGELLKGKKKEFKPELQGAREQYTLKESGSGTELLIEIDMVGEYKEMFEQMWPKALDKLKSMCEGK